LLNHHISKLSTINIISISFKQIISDLSFFLNKTKYSDLSSIQTSYFENFQKIQQLSNLFTKFLKKISNFQPDLEFTQIDGAILKNLQNIFFDLKVSLPNYQSYIDSLYILEKDSLVYVMYERLKLNIRNCLIKTLNINQINNIHLIQILQSFQKVLSDLCNSLYKIQIIIYEYFPILYESVSNYITIT
jgi:hypothetical protein